mmetsp:Transcript_97196/g.308323  ORF Transcript_97196/g.308323 Transcript_97196/m.308323 type:complete len:436 (-) Transcript_97196:144-1451(-)
MAGPHGGVSRSARRGPLPAPRDLRVGSPRGAAAVAPAATARSAAGSGAGRARRRAAPAVRRPRAAGWSDLPARQRPPDARGGVRHGEARGSLVLPGGPLGAGAGHRPHRHRRGVRERGGDRPRHQGQRRAPGQPLPGLQGDERGHGHGRSLLLGDDPGGAAPGLTDGLPRCLHASRCRCPGGAAAGCLEEHGKYVRPGQSQGLGRLKLWRGGARRPLAGCTDQAGVPAEHLQGLQARRADRRQLHHERAGVGPAPQRQDGGILRHQLLAAASAAPPGPTRFGNRPAEGKDAVAGAAPLGPAARRRRHPEGLLPRAHPREPRALRLRAVGRGDGGAGRAGDARRERRRRPAAAVGRRRLQAAAATPPVAGPRARPWRGRSPARPAAAGRTAAGSGLSGGGEGRDVREGRSRRQGGAVHARRRRPSACALPGRVCCT